MLGNNSCLKWTILSIAGLFLEWLENKGGVWHGAAVTQVLFKSIWSSQIKSNNSSQNEFSSSSEVQSYRMGSTNTREVLKEELMLLWNERIQLWWFQDLVRMPPGVYLGRCFKACLFRRRPREMPERLYSSDGPGTTWCPPREISGHGWGEECLSFPTETGG